MALRCFLSLERRLQRFDQFQDYSRVMEGTREWQGTLGHAERVPDADLNKPAKDSFYLAHHAVYKESASSPPRVVFDGSMKTTSGVSLNDQLLVGPTVHPQLNDALSKLLEWSTIPIKITSSSLPLNYPLKNHLLPNVKYCQIQQRSLTPLVSSSSISGNEARHGMNPSHQTFRKSG